jgi:WhiB family transcriptional regulator, redox-sensing transcriptional regulator
MTTAMRRRTTSAAPSLDWRQNAACAEQDGELFFPVGHSAQARRQTQQAKRICAGCSVRTLCLDWAVDNRQYAGVWGGLSEDERLDLYEAPETAFARCLDRQELIEQLVADGATHREVGKEIGVGHYAVARALKYFQLEREALAAAAQAPEGAKAA